LLVGHSLGGALVRLFAAKYPDETAGLMFIDPTDFMLTTVENDQAKSATSSKTGYLEIWKINLSAMTNDSTLPDGVRIDTKRALAASTPAFFKEYQNLPPLKNIPVIALLAYNKPVEPYEEQMNKELDLGIVIKPWWREYDQLRIQHYSGLIANNQNSQIILLPGYSHGIHFQDPLLVAKMLTELHSKCKENNNK
jgi:pimeloyl-ACP methyl ester carboxylesterase